MTDSRFYTVAGPFSFNQLAEIAKAEVSDPSSDKMFVDVAPLQDAGSEHVSFLDNKKYVDAFLESTAGACVVHPAMADRAPQGMLLLLSKDPYRAYARIAQAFYPFNNKEDSINPGAIIDPSAKIGHGCSIAAGVVVGARAEIGGNCDIAANSVIGDGVVIGENSRIGPLVTLAFCKIGANAIIHTGVRIGQDGFGFAMGPEGHLKVPQLGRVLVESDVEIGANTTIDRGTGPDTVIGAGTKIDNLVQIGHNVRTGRGCVIVSQVGISGSTVLGDGVVIGGQAGLAGHLNIGSGVQIAAQSGLMRDVDPGQRVGGSPAQPVRDWMRGVAMLEKLSKKKGE